MSWVVLRSISCKSAYRATPLKRVIDLSLFRNKRYFSITPKPFSKQNLIPEIHNCISELNSSRRSARQAISDRLTKIIAENIKEPELETIFTEIIQKEGKSPALDILARTNPERTATLLCQLDPDLLAKVSFDITFSELCAIVENVIIQKPVILTHTLSKEEQRAQDIAFLVPYNKKPKTWENSFVNFTATHILDELLPEELGEQVFLWIHKKLYPIALNQAKKQGTILEIFNFNMSGFMGHLLGMIVAKGSAINNWNDNLIADYVGALGGHIINFHANLTPEDRIEFYVHFISSVAHLEHFVRRKETEYDVRVLHTLAVEITKTWDYSERVKLINNITKLVERKGTLLSFLDYVRNMM